MKNSKLSSKAILVSLILVSVFIWELIAHRYSTYLFPSLKDIIFELLMGIFKGELLIQLIQSIGIVTVGLFIGTIFAILFAYFSTKSYLIKEIVNKFTAVAHPLPGMALLPLVILWFGIGVKAILIIIIHAVVWPMILNLSTGFQTMSKTYHDLSEIYELSGIKLLYLVYVPASLPYLISGLKTGWARGWRALISAEMIFGAMSSTGGIGWYLFERRVFMDTSGLYAGLILVMLTGMIVENKIFSKLEEKTVNKWGMQI